MKMPSRPKGMNHQVNNFRYLTHTGIPWIITTQGGIEYLIWYDPTQMQGHLMNCITGNPLFHINEFSKLLKHTYSYAECHHRLIHQLLKETIPGFLRESDYNLSFLELQNHLPEDVSLYFCCNTPSMSASLPCGLLSFHSRSAVISTAIKLPSNIMSPSVLLIYCCKTAKWSKTTCRV